MENQSTKNPGPVVEFDLSAPRPRVTIDGEDLQGVGRATLDVTPDDTPVLVLRLIRFEVKGGSLPHGVKVYGRRQGG